MLKAGFVGFGRMGITHFSILNSHPLVEVTSIADTSNTMRGLLSKYLNTSIFSDYRKMIENSDLDFLVISTPTDSHAEVISLAIDNDLHVFAEKPLTMTTQQSAEIVKRVNDKQLVNQVGYVNRFNEVFIEAKRLIDNGVIGEIKYFTSEMYGATVLKGSNATWRSKRNSGGGCMYEFASHCLDLVVFLIGLPDQVAGSVLKSIYSSHVEDMVTSTLIYNTGMTGTVTVNWSDEAYRKPANIVSFFGKKGKIIADKHAYKIYIKEDVPNEDFHQGWNTRYITDFADPVRFYVRGNEFTRQLDYFVDAILKDRKENVSSFTEALKTDMLMESIVTDSNNGSKTIINGAYPSVTPENSKKKLTTWNKIKKRMGLNYA